MIDIKKVIKIGKSIEKQNKEARKSRKREIEEQNHNLETLKYEGINIKHKKEEYIQKNIIQKTISIKNDKQFKKVLNVNERKKSADKNNKIFENSNISNYIIFDYTPEYINKNNKKEENKFGIIGKRNQLIRNGNVNIDKNLLNEYKIFYGKNKKSYLNFIQKENDKINLTKDMKNKYYRNLIKKNIKLNSIDLLINKKSNINKEKKLAKIKTNFLLINELFLKIFYLWLLLVFYYQI